MVTPLHGKQMRYQAKVYISSAQLSEDKQKAENQKISHQNDGEEMRDGCHCDRTNTIKGPLMVPVIGDINIHFDRREDPWCQQNRIA